MILVLGPSGGREERCDLIFFQERGELLRDEGRAVIAFEDQRWTVFQEQPLERQAGLVGRFALDRQPS